MAFLQTVAGITEARALFNILVAVFSGLAVWLLIVFTYNIWFHPLSKYPGPKLWAASYLPYIKALLGGSLVHEHAKIHEDYGEVARVGPNEVSFAVEEAWRDIYEQRPGHKEATKDSTWYIAHEGASHNIANTTDAKVHARMRKYLGNSFTESALKSQQPIIEKYASLFITKLRAMAAAPTCIDHGAAVDMTDWINFFTIDVIGDLSFGEPFGCLDSSEYHPWVRALFDFLKGMVFEVSARLYPWFQAIVLRIMPKNTLENQRRHSGFANERIRRRLSLQTDRPDFMTPFLKQNPDFKYMSQGEIESTFSMLITAGSETSATVLCGILNHLTRPEYRAALRRLERVIRDRFVSEDAITIESTKNIAYLDAVISEGLRLCNPMPGGLPRVVPPGGDMYAGHYLPGGTRVSVRPYVLSRSEKNFALAHEYHPERWLPASERPARFAHDNLKVSKPFSTGPSACLGKPLAWAEMRLILSRLVWAFDMSCDEGRRVDWAKLRAKMMIEKEPMWIRLKIRHNWLVVGHHPEPPCACRTAALAANKSA